MITQGWDELRKNKAQITKVLKEAGLSPALAQLRWAALTKSDRTKIGRVSKGKGWHEEQKPVITKKGIQKKAPIHHKVAVKKSLEKTLRKPMVEKVKAKREPVAREPELEPEPEPEQVPESIKETEEVRKEPEDVTQYIVDKKRQKREKPARKEPEYISSEELFALLDLDTGVGVEAEVRKEEINKHVPEIKKSSITTFLESQLNDRKKDMSTYPIVVAAQTDEELQDVIDFARTCPVAIDIVRGDELNIRLHYRQDDSGKPVRLELSILDLAFNPVYSNNDYDMNLTPAEIRRIEDGELKRQKEQLEYNIKLPDGTRTRAYIRRPDGTKDYTIYDIYPTEHKGIALFAHSIRDESSTIVEWRVTEATTGIKISSGKSSEEAIFNATQLINEKGVDKIRELLAKVRT